PNVRSGTSSGVTPFCWSPIKTLAPGGVDVMISFPETGTAGFCSAGGFAGVVTAGAGTGVTVATDSGWAECIFHQMAPLMASNTRAAAIKKSGFIFLPAGSGTTGVLAAAGAAATGAATAGAFNSSETEVRSRSALGGMVGILVATMVGNAASNAGFVLSPKSF